MKRENEEKFEELKILILNRIQNTSSRRPISAKKLCNEFNLNLRYFKQLITSLREDYPIVSRDTNGGGYWLADNEEDILNYINMINARKNGYEETIKKMEKHLKEI